MTEEIWWSARTDTGRGDPEEHLRIALENRPHHAAYREGAAALRALIRNARKSHAPIEPLLRRLYRLAAEENLLFEQPQLPGIGPVFNLLESISRVELDAIHYPYDEMGYRRLVLLGPAAQKWVVEAWGEPRSHRFAQDLHRAAWDEWVRRYSEDRYRMRRESLRKHTLDRDASGISDREHHAEVDRRLSAAFSE